MLKTSVEIKNPGLLDAYAQLLEKAPEVTNRLVTDVANKERDRLLTQFRKEPGPAAKPFTWKSGKQQRYVMMKLRKEGNLPYRRKHTLVNAWRLLVVYQPGKITSIMLENNDPARRWVVGKDQAPGHEITGWYQEEPLIERSRRVLASKVETALIRGFYSIEER